MIHLAQDVVQWRVLMDTVINLRSSFTVTEIRFFISLALDTLVVLKRKCICLDH
jgi:hypothetical protein